jgi:hypothetical protein
LLKLGVVPAVVLILTCPVLKDGVVPDAWVTLTGLIIAIVAEVVAVPALLVAVIVNGKLKVVVEVGVPVIAPVPVFKLNPVGKVLATTE